MSGVNKVILVGHLGKDPEVRTLEGGSKVANCTLATSESYKNKEGVKVGNTEWHNLVFWNQLAGIVEQFLKKGSQIYVEGKLATRSWEDKDGNKRYTTEVKCDNMVMLGGAGGGTSEGGSSQASVEEDDQLPF